MSRRCVGLLLALVALSALLASRPAAASSRGRLLLLVAPMQEVSADSLLLALSTQLARYELETERQSWRPPADGGARVRLVKQLADAASADFAVFYLVQYGGTGRRVEVGLVDLRSDTPWSRQLALGEPGFGIERSMAAAVVTLVRSRLGRPARPSVASRPASQRGRLRPRRPPTVQVSRPWLLLGAAYRLAALGAELRHGPELSLAARHGALELALDVTLGLPDDDVQGDLSWSRWAAGLGLSSVWAPRLGPRWDLRVGGRAAAVRVAARGAVGAASGARNARAALWEVHVGALGGAAVSLTRRWALVLDARVDWLPVGHRLELAGRDVARSGGVEVSGALWLRVGLL